MDKIFVVDLEATCWNGPPPEGQVSDIIEIGLCTLDIQTGVIDNKESILIKPLRSEVSSFCTELTTITSDMLKGKHSLPTACNYILNKYSPHRRIWAAWGEWDKIRLERECKELGASFPFSGRYVNIKTIFALWNQLNGEVGLAKAMNIAGLKFEGTHHRGHDDAWNTARLLREVMPFKE